MTNQGTIQRNNARKKPFLYEYQPIKFARYVQDKPYDHQQMLLDRVERRLPVDLKSGVSGAYENIKGKQFATATASIERVKKRLEAVGCSLSSSDETIASVARGIAFEVEKLGKECPILGVIQALFTVTLRYGIEVEDIAGKSNAKKYLRIIDNEWWERRIRTLQMRAREQIARELGFVHKKAGVYVTDDTVKRVELRRHRSWEILKTLDAVNQDNDEERLNMYDVAQKSMANPRNRVNELYARSRGFDSYCRRFGHVADFYTLTCPSRYHAYHYSGHKNKKFFEGEMPTPRDGQKYLVKMWAKIRAKLKRENIQVYGFRGAEPHHDGTPHWHMVLYCKKSLRQKVRRIIRLYAVQEDRHELAVKGFNAKCFLDAPLDFKKVKSRYDVMAMDFAKGSGASYLFKYLMKNLLGIEKEEKGDSFDYETADLKDGKYVEGEDTKETGGTVNRVASWASVWGIRQYQQIGGSSITAYRELRRVQIDKFEKLKNKEEIEKRRKALFFKDHTESNDFYELWKSADTADFEGFMILLGGADVAQSEQAINMYKELFDESSVNRYGESVDDIKGVLFANKLLLTRLKNWKIEATTKDLVVDTRSDAFKYEQMKVEAKRILSKNERGRMYRPLEFCK